MLINCPRCGFSQPQDQYCAHCGIDMQNFKPKEQPLLNQILGSLVFQVGLILVSAFFVGQYLLSRPAPQKFVQRIFRSQGITKSESTRSSSNNEELDEETNNSGNSANQHDSLNSANHSGALNKDANHSNDPNTTNTNTSSGGKGTNEIAAPNLKLTYAEVPVELINKWISDSSNSGLYQSLPDYAVGILSDFHKRGDKIEVLKTSDLKILVGSSNTNLSGLMSDDGAQLVGITSAIELKSSENDTLFGSISVTKSSRQGNENYPSEFELPKGSAFFIIGTLKVDNFAQDRTKLQMPPFQIFKSNDFMTRKTEFVIILEPVYK